MPIRVAVLRVDTDGTQTFGIVIYGQGVDEFVDVAVEHAGDVREVLTDAVVGQAVLGEVVGTHFFGTFTSTDLGQS